MKNKSILQLFTLTSVLVIAMSCSKERLPDPPANKNPEPTSSPKPGSDISRPGSLMGQLNPAGVRALIMLTGDLRSYGPYYPDLSNGSFKITDVPSGKYSLDIKYQNGHESGDDDYSLSKSMVVLVEPVVVIDLGRINLD